ncbi:MAG: hypothetical protein ACRBK7_19710, partial [Acidimicrobiales bacterium]
MRKAVDINSQLPTTDVHEGGNGRDHSSVPLKTAPPHPGAAGPSIKARRASWLAVRAEPETTHHGDDRPEASIVALDDDTPSPDGDAAQTSSADAEEAEQADGWRVDDPDLDHQDTTPPGTTPLETADPDPGSADTELSESDDRASPFAERNEAADPDFLGHADERSADPSTTPVVLELRQIAGLTAGDACELQPSASYQFSESLSGHSFRLDVDVDGHVEYLRDPDDTGPGRAPGHGPLPLGSGVLDVGSAR